VRLLVPTVLCTVPLCEAWIKRQLEHRNTVRHLYKENLSTINEST
jgi:hypothetical protein